MPCAAWRHRCQIPDVRAGRPALPSFPRFPLGRIPSSVVRDFYCQSAAAHKAFPRELQDSLAIHRTSVVYPLCTAAFHRAVHSFIHRSWGLPMLPAHQSCRRGRCPHGRLTARAEPFQKWRRQARCISFDRKAPDDARPSPTSARRPDAADRGQGAQPGPAPHDHGGGWPGERAHRGRRRLQPARIRARDLGPASSSASRAASGASSSGSGSSARQLGLGSSSSSSGLQGSSAPSSSSGSGQVTSGGS